MAEEVNLSFFDGKYGSLYLFNLNNAGHSCIIFCMGFLREVFGQKNKEIQKEMSDTWEDIIF